MVIMTTENYKASLSNQTTNYAEKVRAILIDSKHNLILFKRIKPGIDPYWTTPGGYIDSTDSSPLTALKRELMEELNARATNFSQVLSHKMDWKNELIIEYFFAARLIDMDEQAPRIGPEFSDPANGLYEVNKINLQNDSLGAINLKPPALKDFILTNKQVLIDKVK